MSLTRTRCYRKFFGVPNGSKPAKPQQSKLALSPRIKQPAEDHDVETGAGLEKNREEQLQNGKLVKIEEHDVQMVNDDNEGLDVDNVSRIKEESTTSTPQNLRKRASEDAEVEQDNDSDEEPPSKKQKRKSDSHGVRTESSHTPLRSEQIVDGARAKKNGFSPTVNQREPKVKREDTDRSSGNGKTKPTKKAGKAIKEEVGSDDNGQASIQEEQSKKRGGNRSPSVEEEAESDQNEGQESEDEKPGQALKACEKVQSTFKTTNKDPYPDWQPGESVPYAALCTTFSKIELTTKRLETLAHCSLFLRQVLRLTPKDLLPTVQLMVGKLAADYAGIELGIGESLIMKAIGESTGRSLTIIKSDQKAIGDLGLVAAKSRSNQPTMAKPRPLTIRSVHDGLMAIATVEGQGAQGRKIAGIKKLLSAADQEMAGKGLKGVDITKDKGGPSESKFIVRILEGKMRLGLADKTILAALAQAIVVHEISQKGNKMPTTDQMAKSESTLKSVYK